MNDRPARPDRASVEAARRRRFPTEADVQRARDERNALSRQIAEAQEQMQRQETGPSENPRQPGRADGGE